MKLPNQIVSTNKWVEADMAAHMDCTLARAYLDLMSDVANGNIKVLFNENEDD